MAAQQLTIDDELQEFGPLTLELLDALAANGWELALTKPLAGGFGVDVSDGAPLKLLIARRGPIELREVGVSVREVAAKVAKEAARLQWVAAA
jgi:hypothetical protein